MSASNSKNQLKHLEKNLGTFGEDDDSGGTRSEFDLTEALRRRQEKNKVIKIKESRQQKIKRRAA